MRELSRLVIQLPGDLELNKCRAEGGTLCGLANWSGSAEYLPVWQACFSVSTVLHCAHSVIYSVVEPYSSASCHTYAE